MDRLAAGRAIHAPRVSGQWLSRSTGPTDPRSVAMGKIRALGELQGEHVHDGIGEARLRREADELPWPCAYLQFGSAQLSRIAAALRRIRRVPSQRAVGCAARPDAVAGLHAG